MKTKLLAKERQSLIGFEGIFIAKYNTINVLLCAHKTSVIFMKWKPRGIWKVNGLVEKTSIP